MCNFLGINLSTPNNTQINTLWPWMVLIQLTMQVRVYRLYQAYHFIQYLDTAVS